MEVKYNAGQVFEDKEHKLHVEEKLCFCYLLLSLDQEEDGNEYWKCAVFMDYTFGAYTRLLTQEEVSQLHYVGHIQSFQAVKCNP